MINGGARNARARIVRFESGFKRSTDSTRSGPTGAGGFNGQRVASLARTQAVPPSFITSRRL